MKPITFTRFANIFFALSAGIALSASMTGCVIAPAQGGPAPSYSGNVYRSSDTLGEMSVRYGRVMSVRPVAVDAGQSGVGIATGAVLGGFLGNKVGNGNGRTAATVLGAIAGGVAGSNVESNMRTATAMELVIRLDSGHDVAVIQASGNDLVVGDRVRLTGSGNNVRVSR